MTKYISSYENCHSSLKRRSTTEILNASLVLDSSDAFYSISMITYVILDRLLLLPKRLFNNLSLSL